MENHQGGTLRLSDARPAMNLSVILPSLRAREEPITIPNPTTAREEEVNNRIVFGSFSFIKSFTLLEPS